MASLYDKCIDFSFFIFYQINHSQEEKCQPLVVAEIVFVEVLVAPEEEEVVAAATGIEVRISAVSLRLYENAFPFNTFLFLTFGTASQVELLYLIELDVVEVLNNITNRILVRRFSHPLSAPRIVGCPPRTTPPWPRSRNKSRVY